MLSRTEHFNDPASSGKDAPQPHDRDEARSWPRCEPAFTHFELGASSENRPTALMTKRYTPRYGVRKE
jgi:hypothetical protein